MNKNITRQSNIELLRIFLMILVIIVHFNIPGGHAIEHARNHPINLTILYILESMGLCAVNTFVMITGYFMCNTAKVKVLKAIGLLIQVSVYSVVFYLIEVARGQVPFSAGRLVMNTLPNSWFTAIYVALYLFSPFINCVIQKLSRKQFQLLLVISFILFSLNPTVFRVMQDILGWDTSELSAISIKGSGEGYTIVNFIFMYLIGAYIRMHGINIKCKPVVVYGISVAVIFAGTKFLQGYSSMFYEYCNVFVILEAVALFLLFQQMSIPHIRVINTISKYAFSVYLLHGHFYILFNTERIATANPLVMLGWICVLCVTLYAISWLIGLVYDYLSKLILKRIRIKDYVIEI